MCSRTSIRSLPGRGRRRRSPTRSWSRWRSVRRRWGSALTGSSSAWSLGGYRAGFRLCRASRSTTAGCAARSEFAGVAAYGFCAAKSEWVWGVRLVLRADRRGLPLGFTLVPANEHEYEPLLDLVDPGETVIGDKGLWGRTYNQRMA